MSEWNREVRKEKNNRNKKKLSQKNGAKIEEKIICCYHLAIFIGRVLKIFVRKHLLLSPQSYATVFWKELKKDIIV